MKALRLAGAAIAAVIVILALLMVIGIPSGFLTSAVQDRVERQTGYKLTVAGSTHASMVMGKPGAATAAAILGFLAKLPPR